MVRASQKNKSSPTYDLGVFINCPFDKTYKPLFDSLVFATIYCGYRARCAREIDDGSQVRVEKIFKIIEECQFGIHDLSRTELDRKSRLPRFNMPLELGMFLAAKRFGGFEQKKKHCLILDRQDYGYQKFISDIAGQDIRSHSRDIKEAISAVRDWLRTFSKRSLPGGTEIYRQYLKFGTELPDICKKLRLKRAELTFNDLANIVTEWIKAQLAAR